MSQKIELKLSQIKYTGKSIGDDIRAEIEILDKLIQIKKRISVNKTVELDQEIGSFITDQSSFEAKIKIVIIEEDVLFNDVKSLEETLTIDVTDTTAQKFIYNVELRENRFGKTWGKSVATFEVAIKAIVVEAIKYVPDINNGWIKVKILDSDTVSLPAFLKVRVEYTEGGREYFTILEGPYRGQKASVVLDNNNSLLLTEIEHEPSIYLRYSISEKILTFEDKKYKATDHPDSPWEKGWYDIELPDYPHPGGSNYLNKSARAKTWFRIGHQGERYLHTGSRSLGCMTITEVEKWDEIYNKLIKARKGDFLSVGTIEVTD